MTKKIWNILRFFCRNDKQRSCEHEPQNKLVMNICMLGEKKKEKEEEQMWNQHEI